MNVLRILPLIMVALTLAIIPSAAQENGTGTITGLVLTGNNVAIPDAYVTLYPESDVGVDAYQAIPDNPQLTSNFTHPVVGVYTFYDVPYGIYNVTAEKDGESFYAIVNVTAGTATANIVIPGVDDTWTAADFSPEPGSPGQYYTYVPVKIEKDMQDTSMAKSPGFDVLTAVACIVLPGLAWRNRKQS